MVGARFSPLHRARSERRAGLDPTSEAALAVRLRTFPREIYALSPSEPIRAVSRRAEVALERDRPEAERRLATWARTHELAWHSIPLATGPLDLVSVAVRLRPADARVRDAARRWCLTARQAQVMSAIADGKLTPAIAASLGIAQVTVEKHISAIFTAAGATDRTSLLVSLWLADDSGVLDSPVPPSALLDRIAHEAVVVADEDDAVRGALAALAPEPWETAWPMDGARARVPDGVLVVGPRGAPEELARRLSARAGMSDLERWVLSLLLRGKCNKEIASEIGCSEVSVEARLTKLYRRTGARNRYELITLAASGRSVPPSAAPDDVAPSPDHAHA